MTNTPYAVTFMYGQDGDGSCVQLRFNWITDCAADMKLICEAAATFEANGNAFSAQARHVAGICALLENTTQLVNDEIGVHINTASHYCHKAEIYLNAGCDYYYAIEGEEGGSRGLLTAPVRVRTRPPLPAAFSFLWIADPQQDKYARGTHYVPWDGKITRVGGGNFQENMELALAHAYAPAQARHYINGAPDFAICTGDHCEHIYDKDGMDDFFRAGRVMLEATPYFPAIGNHDMMGAPGHTGTWDSPDPYALLFKGRFNPPKNGAAYIGGDDTPAATGEAARVLDGLNYFFTYGNALFMVLQGNPWHTAEYAIDEQIAWMRHVVSSHGENRWKIVFMHQGIYTVSYKSVHEYEKLSAFYDEAGIDLVLSGHNHVYARSKPIRSFLPVQRGEGTVHITGGTVSSNCAWGGYVYKPERQVPENDGLPMTELMNFLSLTDQVDEQNKNIYHIITVDERGISITALRAHDDTVVKHNAPQPADTAQEYQTLLTGAMPLAGN